MRKIVLECSNLSKKFFRKVIVKDISFSLCEGDILGFIGANGAGKTTIIKTILGLYRKSGGKVSIMGYDVDKDFVKAISYVGAIVENPDMYSYLSGYDNLKLVGNLYGVSDERIREVVRLVGLEDSIRQKVNKYSLGMKQRLGIAQAILHMPSILILDEPTNGLDPEGIKDLKRLLLKLASSGMAVIVSSHILKELESFCNKYCIIDRGRLVKFVEEKDLKELTRWDNYILELGKVDLEGIISDYERLDDKCIRVKIGKGELKKIIEILLDNDIDIFEIRRDTMSLEEIYLSCVRGNNSD